MTAVGLRLLRLANTVTPPEGPKDGVDVDYYGNRYKAEDEVQNVFGIFLCRGQLEWAKEK